VVRPDEELAKMDLRDRREAAEDILGRIPANVRPPRSKLPGELLERITDPRMVEAARTWLPERGNLLLLGPTERGKSAAAAYCFRRLLGRGVFYGGEAWKFARWMWWFGAKDLERSRLEHKLGAGEAPEMLRAAGASLLVIDDAGWDRDPAAVSAILAERYEDARPTIVTAESLARLTEHYGAAVVRRMAEAGGPRVTIVEAA
jgi:DNA replication protein DnaC